MANKTSLTPEKNLFCYLYKCKTSEMPERTSRINLVINPIYYLSLDGDGHPGWAHYSEVFVENIFPEKLLRVMNTNYEGIISYLFSLVIKHITKTNEYRRIVSDRLPRAETNKIKNLLKTQGITFKDMDDIAFMVAIEIISILRPKQSKVILLQNSSSESIPLYDLGCFYQLYWDKGKVRFLLTEKPLVYKPHKRLIHSEFEYPSGVVVYHGDVNDPRLHVLTQRLEKKSLKEDTFRMIEQHLENHFICSRETETVITRADQSLVVELEGDPLMHTLKLILPQEEYLFLGGIILNMAVSFAQKFMFDPPTKN